MAWIRDQKGTFTPSAGLASVTIRLNDCLLKQIAIDSTTSSTTFDVKITNSRSIDVYDVDDFTGYALETVDIPLSGNATLTIDNASVDEVFTYYVSCLDKI